MSHADAELRQDHHCTECEYVAYNLSQPDAHVSAQNLIMGVWQKVLMTLVCAVNAGSAAAVR